MSRVSEQSDFFLERVHKFSFAVMVEMGPVVLAEANRLADAIRESAPVGHNDTITKDSVRVRKGKYDNQYFVEAGGSATTNAAGYDHVRALEFGTTKMRAHPFFRWNYNLM